MSSSPAWQLTPIFVLRHAGMPFDWLESLGVGVRVLEAMDAVLAAEAKVLGQVPSNARGSVAQALAKGRPPSSNKRYGTGFALALSEWASARTRYAAEYAHARTGLRTMLRERARDVRVQEAVFLSSPDMYENVWLRYLDGPPELDNANTRRMERQAYSYLQRFCAKSETTSFFGPMGYGVVEGGDAQVEVQRLPGPESERRRRTFLSFWAVQELARAITREKELRPHLPFRRNPAFVVEESRAFCPANQAEVPIGSAGKSVLAALERPRTRAELAGLAGAALGEWEAALVPLVKAGVVVRGLFYETQCFDVFSRLRAALSSLPETEAGRRWLSGLDALDALRARFEGAPLAERRTLLPELEKAFTALTGVPARRGEGQMYSDRLMIYEEGGSPFRLRFGEAFARRLERALTPSLELCAAFGDAVQDGYRSAARDALGAGTELSFLSYAAALRPESVEGSRFSPVQTVALPEDVHPDSVPPDVCGPSRPGPRFVLPDVCLEAKSDGDYEILLSRVHHHLLTWCWLSAFFEGRDVFERSTKRWVETKAQGLIGLSLSRRNKGFYSFPGPRMDHAPGSLEGKDALPSSHFRVQVTEAGPRLLDAEGKERWLYLALADFSTYPPFAALTHPLVLQAPLRAKGEKTPRLRVGEAVYQRARWELRFEDFAQASGADLLLEARRLVARHGWPRFLFARVRGERKPVLFDTQSPFSCELVRHLLHENPDVMLEEMLPSPEGLFLRDEHGRYPFELRMQFTRS